MRSESSYTAPTANNSSSERLEKEGDRPRRQADEEVRLDGHSDSKPQEPNTGLPPSSPNELDGRRQGKREDDYQAQIEDLQDRLERALLALGAAEARYEDLYGGAPIAFFTVGAQAKILSCNHHASHLLGLPRPAAPRRRLTDFMSADNGARFRESYKRLTLNTPISFELEMHRVTGQPFWAELTMVLAPEGGENVCRVVLTDQSARRRMQEGAAQLAAIVTSADQAIISEDLNGFIMTWNAGAEKLFGYPAERAIGFSIDIVVPIERRDEEQEFRARVQRGITVAEETVRLQRNGALVPVHVTASPMFGPKGHVIGISQIVRDISEQVADRQAAARLLEDLRRADRRKDDFIATLAHELRNPLAPIRNAATVMRFVPDLDPKLLWCRDVIDRQVTHMAALLEDLLDISRLTRDLIKLRRDRIELGTAISQAIEINRPLVDSRGHTLTVQLPTQPIVVEGDLTRLTQIFGNLLNNAAKYTEPNGTIGVSVERRHNDVVIRVSDTGIGIAAENLGNIFDLFAQIDPTREGHQGGLGIGLALVKGLVERHNGTITVRSNGIGQGSEFTMILPLASPLPGERDSDGAAEQRMKCASRALRVLIVDDNVDAAESMAVMLGSGPHRIDTANDGATALALAAQIRPHVIVLDLGMPKMSGYEVARRVRSEPWGNEIVMVACTGWGQPEDRRRSREAGFDHHLVKPVNVDAVLQILNELADAEAG